MYIAVVVCSIQRKSRFTVAEKESRYFAVAEGVILVSNKNGWWDINWLKNPQGVVPLSKRPSLFHTVS